MAAEVSDTVRQVNGVSEHAQAAFASHDYLDALNAFDMARCMLDEGTARHKSGTVADLRRELRLNCSMAALYASDFKRAELEASKVLDANVDEDDGEAFLRRALARARLGSFTRATSDVTAGLACCAAGDQSGPWRGLEHLRTKLPRLAAADARRKRNAGVDMETRTTPVVPSSEADMSKLMRTIHEDDELRILCQADGAKRFVEAVDRDAHAIFDPEQMGYLMADEDARKLYAKLQARNALPTSPPPLPFAAADGDGGGRRGARSHPPALERAPPFKPYEVGKMATLAGASPRHVKWLENNADGLAKLAIRGDGGEALGRALEKVGLAARRYRELLFAYFRGSRKFDPKYFEEGRRKTAVADSRLAGAFDGDGDDAGLSPARSAPVPAKKAAPWRDAPYPVWVSDAQCRRDTGALAGELAAVLPSLPAAANHEPPLRLLPTFSIADTAQARAEADPVCAVGINANVCAIVVAALEKAGGKHAVCCVRGGGPGLGTDSDWAFPDVGAALLDAARGDAAILESPHAVFYVFLGHLNRVKDGDASRLSVELFESPSRPLWAALSALKRAGVLDRTTLVTRTIRQDERVGATARGVFRCLDPSLRSLARSDAEEDARHAKLQRASKHAPVTLSVMQNAPNVPHTGEEWTECKIRFWRLAEIWIYESPRGDAWWKHLERAVVILIHAYPKGDEEVPALAAALEAVFDQADADFPADWWDVPIPEDFDYRVLEGYDDEGGGAGGGDDDEEDGLVVEELDPATADPKTSKFTFTPDGRKIDEDGYLVEDD